MPPQKQARAGDRPGRTPRTPAKAKASTSTAARAAAGRGGSGRPAAGGGPGGQRPAGRQDQTRRARDRAKARELAVAGEAAQPAPAGPPRWLQITTLVLAIGGLGVSIYMTIEHFTGNSTLACSTSGGDNCLKVTTSAESMVFGVFPVAVLGLAFYLFMAAATTPMAWRSRRREVALARLASAIVGVGFILYLIYVEIYQVGAICLWCTSVHVITFLLFALVTLAAALYGEPKQSKRIR